MSIIHLKWVGLSPNLVTDGATAGTVVGALSGLTPGSTRTLTQTAGGRFALNAAGDHIIVGATPINLSDGGTWQVYIRESIIDQKGTEVRTTSIWIGVTAKALSISSGPIPQSAIVGVSYPGFTAAASHGTTPYAYSLSGSLPAGLSLNSSTGAVTGTPTTPGVTSGVSVVATDANSLTASLSVPPITVAAAQVNTDYAVPSVDTSTGTAEITYPGLGVAYVETVKGELFNLTGHDYCYQVSTSNNKFHRFEVHYHDPSWIDTGGNATIKDRSHLDFYPIPHFQWGVDYWVRMDILIEPGAVVSSAQLFNDLFAVHSDNQTASPPLSTRLNPGDYFSITCLSTASPNTDTIIYRSPTPITRGVPHRLKIHFRCEKTGNGLVEAWFDGDPIANYVGPIGYAADPTAGYGKIGLYRYATNQILAMQYGNVTWGTTDLSVESGQPVWPFNYNANSTLNAAYIGNEAADLTTFETWHGKPNDAIQIHGGRNGISDYVSSWDWVLASPQIGNVTGRTPVLTLPLFCSPTITADQPTAGLGTETLATVAGGLYDSYWTSIAGKIAAKFPTGTIIIRMGEEMNGDWMPWKATSGTAANFIACYQRYHDILVTALGSRAKFDFCPNVGQNGAPWDKDWRLFYPGDAYVDYITMDLYWSVSGGQSTDPAVAFDTFLHANYGLNTLISFAQVHSKFPALHEWGQSQEGDGWIELVGAWCKRNRVAYQGWWNSTIGSIILDTGANPLAEAAYKATF